MKYIPIVILVAIILCSCGFDHSTSPDLDSAENVACDYRISFVMPLVLPCGTYEQDYVSVTGSLGVLYSCEVWVDSNLVVSGNSDVPVTSFTGYMNIRPGQTYHVRARINDVIQETFDFTIPFHPYTHCPESYPPGEDQTVIWYLSQSSMRQYILFNSVDYGNGMYPYGSEIALDPNLRSYTMRSDVFRLPEHPWMYIFFGQENWEVKNGVMLYALTESCEYYSPEIE